MGNLQEGLSGAARLAQCQTLEARHLCGCAQAALLQMGILGAAELVQCPSSTHRQSWQHVACRECAQVQAVYGREHLGHPSLPAHRAQVGGVCRCWRRVAAGIWGSCKLAVRLASCQSCYIDH